MPLRIIEEEAAWFAHALRLRGSKEIERIFDEFERSVNR